MLIGIYFLVLIAMNFFVALPTICSKLNYQKVENSENIEYVSEEKPNVYFFICDEYAGVEGLERYYNYDNRVFLKHIEENGFNISTTSHNYESCSTTVNIPNLLNLEYVASPDELEANNLKYMKNPKLYQIFKTNGYTINLINHTQFLDEDGCNVIATSDVVDTISTYILQKSIFQLIKDYKAEQIETSTDTQYYVSDLKNILNTMQTCYKMVDKEKPTLTIGYVSCPHPPFVIDEEGGAVDYRNTSNWADKSLYLNQLKYVNACMENAVDGILQNDRNAIIIIQSDHGVRYPYHMMECYGTPEYDATIETPYMQNILNCVYYQGKEMDIEGKSGINTLRIVLNEIFMTNYEMLDNPEKYLYQYK